MEDVDVVTIPTKFIQRLHVTLASGEEIIYMTRDLLGLESIEEILDDMDFHEPIADVKVILDFHTLEKEVTAMVTDLFDKAQNKND